MDTGQVTGQVHRQPESIESRVLGFPVEGPRGKAEISSHLGQKEISGQLNQMIRRLLAERSIEYTIPSKPNSRLQKYRLTDSGAAYLKTLRQGRASP